MFLYVVGDRKEICVACDNYAAETLWFRRQSAYCTADDKGISFWQTKIDTFIFRISVTSNNVS